MRIVKPIHRQKKEAEISAEGGRVLVTWSERNQIAKEPVVRVSIDDGQTFGQY